MYEYFIFFFLKMKKHNNIDKNQSLEATTKTNSANNVTTKTNANLIESLNSNFVRKYEFLSKLESFTNDMDDDSVRIIWEKYYTLPQKRIKKFEPVLNEYLDILDDEIMLKLYNFGFKDFVLNHMNIFKWRLDASFITKLFIDWYIDYISPKFVNKRELIDSLVWSKEYEIIIDNIDYFKDNVQYIVNKMIDEWQWTYICDYLSTYLNKINIYQTVERMEKAGVEYKYIYSFIQRYKSYLEESSTNL